MSGFDFEIKEISLMPEARVEAADLIDQYLAPVISSSTKDFFEIMKMDVILGAFHEGRIVGVSDAQLGAEHDEWRANCLVIPHLVTDATFERKGVASQLLIVNEQIAKFVGMRAVMLADSSGIECFFERRGFNKQPVIGWHYKTVASN